MLSNLEIAIKPTAQLSFLWKWEQNWHYSLHKIYTSMKWRWLISNILLQIILCLDKQHFKFHDPYYLCYKTQTTLSPLLWPCNQPAHILFVYTCMANWGLVKLFVFKYFLEIFFFIWSQCQWVRKSVYFHMSDKNATRLEQFYWGIMK